MELERLIREADPRVVNSSGSHYTDAVAVTAMANTTGFAGRLRLDAGGAVDRPRRAGRRA